jgi:hypothetical protein
MGRCPSDSRIALTAFYRRPGNYEAGDLRKHRAGSTILGLRFVLFLFNERTNGSGREG